jgi:hypothetical protein
MITVSTAEGKSCGRTASLANQAKNSFILEKSAQDRAGSSLQNFFGQDLQPTYAGG